MISPDYINNLFLLFVLLSSNNSNKSIKKNRNKSYVVSMKNRAFPLDEVIENKPEKKLEENPQDIIINNTSSTNIIEAVDNINPYLYPKNQVMVKAFVKFISLLSDLNIIINHKYINSNEIKKLDYYSLSKIINQLKPYLNKDIQNKINNIDNNVENILQLQNEVKNVRVNLLNSASMKEEGEQFTYILNQLKPFIPTKNYQKIKNFMDMIKLIETTKDLQKTQEVDTKEEYKQEDIAKDKELNDIMELMDIIDKKNNKKSNE